MEKHPSKPTEAGKYNNQYENIQPFTGNAILSAAVGELKKKKAFFPDPILAPLNMAMRGIDHLESMHFSINSMSKEHLSLYMAMTLEK